MSRSRFLLLAALALASGIGAFAVGRLVVGFSRSQTKVPKIEVTTAEASDVSSVKKSIGGAQESPDIDFTDEAGLAACVEKLKKAGITEALARWLAISTKVRQDLRGSFELARKADLEDEWAVAAALSDPERGFELIRTLPPPPRDYYLRGCEKSEVEGDLDLYAG